MSGTPEASSHSHLIVVTAEERPDLWAESDATFLRLWPEYNLHGDVAGRYFGVLLERYARFQLLVWDDAAGRAVARGRTIPFRWDGSLEDLPRGIDAVGLRAVTDTNPPTTLSALSAEVARDQQGRGLSRLVLQSMADAARHAGLRRLVAPVRPSRKDRYPLIPIEQYVSRVRDDRLPFDPWLRVHARLGGERLRPEPHSMRITGPVAEWTDWTGMKFPTDGSYVFPGGLAPLDVHDGVGRYWEPNVWMLHWT